MLGMPFNRAIDMSSLGLIVAEWAMKFPLYPGINEYEVLDSALSASFLTTSSFTHFLYVTHTVGTVGKGAHRLLYVIDSVDRVSKLDKCCTKNKDHFSMDRFSY